MTNGEMNDLAEKIRWHWQNNTPGPQPPKPTAEEQISKAVGRPLGPQDLGMIAAHTMDQWGPNFFVKTRQQRKILRKIQRYMKSPDLSGLSGPSEEEWEQFPGLYEQFCRERGIKIND